VVTVRYTLTTPGCPMEEYITAAIRMVVGALAWVGEVRTDLVWDPAWNPGMIRAGAL
jgi:metal-sulfur cluster biosynthetic enzyme